MNTTYSNDTSVARRMCLSAPKDYAATAYSLDTNAIASSYVKLETSAFIGC